jgi:hypothetical protein
LLQPLWWLVDGIGREMAKLEYCSGGEKINIALSSRGLVMRDARRQR